MTDIHLINQDDEQFATEQLKDFYQDQLIPAEKKTYLSSHHHSLGPYMGIKNASDHPHYLMDAASQIATLGLGFNSKPFWGTSHFKESWTNDYTTKNFKKIRKAFENLLKREASLDFANITFCNSGAEANEVALGYAYKRRVHKEANKVLAFEGSFHGRMLVSLFSTWNKSKREPYQLPGFETVYCKLRELPDSQIHLKEPADWRLFWSSASLKESSEHLPLSWMSDPLLKDEVNSLIQVQEQLKKGQIFAIIIEPMQCEGGDRYISSRYFNALCLLAKNYQVQLICDEVQTGFHLGRDFFWHRSFDLKDPNGTLLSPDYVVCAKKAQVGVVISTHHSFQKSKLEEKESFSSSSLIRGYIHALALSNRTEKILELEKDTSERLNNLISKHSEYISRPRVCGMSFAFDVNNPDLVAPFIGERFKNGLLYYPAGEKTLRFRLNLSFKKEDLDFLFERLDNICQVLFLKKEHQNSLHVKTPVQDPSQIIPWQKLLFESKMATLKGEQHKLANIAEKAVKLFKEETSLELIRVTETNFKSFHDKIINLEKEVYEPTRQTDIQNFETCASSDRSYCFAVLDNGQLAAIIFSSSLADHPLERGVRLDNDFENANSIYMIDTTVSPKYRGKGLGQKLKYLMALHAYVDGVEYIKGRNRHGLAYNMLAINLSMGSFEQFYLEEDYMDFKKYRGVSYYQTPLHWQKSEISLNDSIDRYLDDNSIDNNFIENNTFILNNKVCLSNFVNTSFLNDLKDTLKQFPESLRHGYSASGQSECVDKIAKSIYYNRKSSHKSITFDKHYFGNGSFLSRSLSSSEDSFFPVEHLDHPTEHNYKEVLSTLQKKLSNEDYLGIWIEPIRTYDMAPVPFDFLKELKLLCSQKKVPLIFNETNSRDFGYTEKACFASNLEEITPDAVFSFLGGQAGVVAISEEYFVSKPLMMISTWDGDEFSFKQYRKYQDAISSLTDREKVISEFEKTFKSFLQKRDCILLNLNRAKGSFKGNLPVQEQGMFTKDGNRWIFHPSFLTMKTFTEKFHE